MYSDDYEFDNYKNSKSILISGEDKKVYAWEDYVYPNYDNLLNVRRDRFTGLRLS